MPQALTDAMRPVAELFGFAPAAVVKDLIDSVGRRGPSPVDASRFSWVTTR